MTKNKVLVLINHFLPGFKYGGPIRSVQALSSKLGEFMDFSIITSDRDLGDKRAYSKLKFNNWVRRAGHQILYFQGDYSSFIKLVLTEAKKNDVIYLNSFFNPKYSFLIILLKYLGLLKNKIIVAPRGEFNSGALGIKSKKKQIFINIAKFLKFYNSIVWHATTHVEYEAIKNIFGSHSDVRMAEGMSPQTVHWELAKNTKELNVLKLVYLARVAKIKNLLFLLNVLAELKVEIGKIQLAIFGPLEDHEYWEECRQLIAKINNNNPNISISYQGEIEYDKVKDILPNYDFFVLPTFGENFGQSIADAFSVGVPVIISQHTPWKDLHRKGIGWDLPLDVYSFSTTLKECLQIDSKAYSILSNNSLKFAESFLNDPRLIKQYQDLFAS